MRLEWIDDILAVLDTGSLARAAERRLLTQSAFTRRVRMIEDSIGATLFDRRRKPVTLLPGVLALEPELRDLSARLHQLQATLRTSSGRAGKRLAFVCQHALTTTVSPRIVRSLTAGGETSVRVHSGNQDECLMRLISRDVDFAIMYALPDEAAPEAGNAFHTVTLGSDLLVPVATPALGAEFRGAAGPQVIPTIAYPPEVFLGQVFTRSIAPTLPRGATALPVAETALTLAMLELALDGIGVAWLPQSLAAEHLASGRLARLDTLPTQPLTIRMLCLSETRPQLPDALWQALVVSLPRP